MDKQMTDREVYPAVWIVLVGLVLVFGLWKYVLHEPTISACWIYQNWQVYCPACGGTRALIALAQRRGLRSLYYHPVVPVTSVCTAVYLISQTIWRLRGKRGWVLHYHPRFPYILFALLAVNWLVRNVLWLGFGIGI